MAKKPKSIVREHMMREVSEGEKLDLLFIDPPYKGLRGIGPECSYSLGMTYLAAYLRDAGIKTAVLSGDLVAGAPQNTIFNFNVKRYAEGQKAYSDAINGSHIVWDKIIETIRRSRPVAVGLSYMSPMKSVVDKVASLIKNAFPDIKIIIGGHHATFCPEEILSNSHVDFVIRGESEKPLLRLIEELKKPVPDFKSVPALNYRIGDGSILSTADAEPISDLDSLPFPARELVIDPDYARHQTHLLITARGCPFSCSFCADPRFWHGKVRRRSVENVMEEIKMIVLNYPLKILHIVDGTFTYDKKYVLKFCEALISAGFKFPWACTARYDTIDREMLDAMRKAGCQALYFGLESGSAHILDIMKKRVTIAEIKEKSKLVRKMGFTAVASVILGLPGETRQDIEETLHLMRLVPVDLFDVNCYVPLPGTPFFDALSENERKRIDWSQLAYKMLDGHFTSSITARDMKELTVAAHKIELRKRSNFLARMVVQNVKEKVISLFRKSTTTASVF